uniref:Methionine aminopeptidase n=1 Tax=Chenopodium quinoa TaxID=63459 RepID=A0A803KSD7_CHEQI
MATNVGGAPDQPQSEHETDQVSKNHNKEQGAKRKRMKERSEVWEHFIKEDLASGRQAICKYCGMSYKCGAKKNGTSVLWAHISRCRRKHVSMQLPKSLSGLTNLLFNRRNLEQVSTRERKPLRPGKVSPPRPVPSHIKRPPYVKTGSPPGIASGPEVHDERGIECMRASGRLAAEVLEYAGTLVKLQHILAELDFLNWQFSLQDSFYRDLIGVDLKVLMHALSLSEYLFLPRLPSLSDPLLDIPVTLPSKPGVKTDEIDEAVHQMIIDNGGYPSPLGYGGFPKSVCTSVNECICHGIPDSRPLEDGDIINIDVTAYLNGYHGDTSATFFCGEVDDEAKNLVQVTKECLDKAIAICGPGVEYKKIGRTIHDHADKYGYGVVRQFVGHGVGRVFHADPVVLHCRNNDGGRMILNQTFTIEPMLTMGSYNPIMWDDNWTVVTEDGSLSAQFEHTILITKDGAEILTQC